MKPWSSVTVCPASEIIRSGKMPLGAEGWVCSWVYQEVPGKGPTLIATHYDTFEEATKYAELIMER